MGEGMMKEQPFFVTNGGKFEAHVREFCPLVNRHYEKTVFGPTADERAVLNFIKTAKGVPHGI